MGSITLPRMRSVRPEEKEHGSEALSSRHPFPASVGAARRRGVQRSPAEGEAHPNTTRRQMLPVVIAPLLVPLASAATRHWLIEAAATLCVAGGFIAAPFLTVTAWIGLALPRRVVLHQASTALFVIAILWMAAALIGAHLHHSRRLAQAARCSDGGE